MKRRIATILAALALLAGTSVITESTPAVAAWSECPGGVACVWLNDDASGPHLTISVGQFGSGCWNWGGIWTNNIQAAMHTFGSGRQLKMYVDPYCSESGGYFVAGLRGWHYTFPAGSLWANKFSSFRII